MGTLKTKHTKGKWICKEQGDANEFVILTDSDDGRRRWVIAFRLNGEFHRIEEEANVKLIAAAPDLLNAAMLISDGISSGDKQKFHDGNMAIKEAIKKATE